MLGIRGLAAFHELLVRRLGEYPVHPVLLVERGDPVVDPVSLLHRSQQLFVYRIAHLARGLELLLVLALVFGGLGMGLVPALLDLPDLGIPSVPVRDQFVCLALGILGPLAVLIAPERPVPGLIGVLVPLAPVFFGLIVTVLAHDVQNGNCSFLT